MIIRKETVIDGKVLSLESGELAPRAHVSVKATYGDTVVLATVVAGKVNPDLDYFPLQVSYEEKLYASGTIRTSRFMKRDGRPTDSAVVTRRLIDRGLRPLFPKDFSDEVQIIITVLSLDPEADPVFLSLIAASAALQASKIPWNGPVIGQRIGFIDQTYVLNPNPTLLTEKSELDMVVFFSGLDKKFLSIDCKANILAEEKILGAIEFARNRSDDTLTLIMDFAKAINPTNEKSAYVSTAPSAEAVTEVSNLAKDAISQLYSQELTATYESKKAQEGVILADLYKKLEGKFKKSEIDKVVAKLKKATIQNLVLTQKIRNDGRKLDEIRPISGKVGLLPRTHGSALFSRGLTQALTIASLGNPSMELLIQDMYGEVTKRYMHYYNFPPFSVGETGQVGSPKPREIGHGMLAEKALVPVLPSQTDFPYTILLTTEILSSDGSSSMAATCGSTLALMDAGVPITDVVGGVAMGLMADDTETQFEIVTDLNGTEDALGYMDFKMTGTKTGVTAIQADLKLNGLPMSLVPNIIEQSKLARLKIIEELEKIIAKPRTSLSQYAPKMITTQIDVEKIGMIIGPGGKTIREIQEKTDTLLSIESDGKVYITAQTEENAQKAFEIINGMTKKVLEGDIYEGKVVEILDFGALVEYLPGRSGLLHVSEIANTFVKNVTDFVNIGDIVKVKVVETGQNGKVSLSMKALEVNPQGPEPQRRTDHRREDRRPNFHRNR